MNDIKHQDRLRNLHADRRNQRSQISHDVRYLKNSLKPKNLLERAARSVKYNAIDARGKAVAKIKSNPGTAFAVGGTLLAALLYRPAKALISRIQMDERDRKDYLETELIESSFNDEE
ncbi:hypothetical protein MNBD_ALPHA04-95 [hydrothermal vent metagenome]|uniref:Uncharacterized protein n=1 Tax=hydrothermal vent metagenome TaxID=652676 RepID=A0A3B0SAI4_9ZZZZ